MLEALLSSLSSYAQLLAVGASFGLGYVSEPSWARLHFHFFRVLLVVWFVAYHHAQELLDRSPLLPTPPHISETLVSIVSQTLCLHIISLHRVHHAASSRKHQQLSLVGHSVWTVNWSKWAGASMSITFFSSPPFPAAPIVSTGLCWSMVPSSHQCRHFTSSWGSCCFQDCHGRNMQQVKLWVCSKIASATTLIVL